MSWPAASHFSLSLQNPRAGLRSRELHSLRVTRDKLGQPRPWSGAFAVVFQGTDPGGRSVALRAFTSDIPERIERYHAISTHLARQRPRCLVGFQLQPEGIRSSSNGKWYPLIVMDWVRGETLFDWVRTRCEKRDQAALNRIATAWVGLVEELSAALVRGMGASYRPEQVLLVDDLPRTRNMKIMRRVLRAVLENKDPGDLSALANPEAVDALRTRIAAR